MCTVEHFPIGWVSKICVYPSPISLREWANSHVGILRYTTKILLVSESPRNAVIPHTSIVAFPEGPHTLPCRRILPRSLGEESTAPVDLRAPYMCRYSAGGTRFQRVRSMING